MFPLTNPSMIGYKKLIDEISKRTNGQVVINYKGGPEVIPELNQPKALAGGTIDITAISALNFDSQVPESRVMPLSPFNSAEEVKAGYLDFMRKAFADKANVYWLMTTNKNTSYFLGLNTEVKTPQELKGLKFRSHAMFQPWLDALEIKGVMMPGGDIYNGMKLKTIDGYAWTPPSAVDASLHEVTKFWIEPFVWGGGGVVTVVNMKSWNALPKNLQDTLNKLGLDLEAQMEKEIDELHKNVGKVMASKGMKPLTFSAADTKFYIEAANNAKWEQVKAGVKPDVFEKLRAMLTKK